MTLADFPQLKSLTKRQRLALAEELWLSSTDDRPPVSKARKRILDDRWSAYKAGESKRITLAELERRLARK